MILFIFNSPPLFDDPIAKLIANVPKKPQSATKSSFNFLELIEGKNSGGTDGVIFELMKLDLVDVFGALSSALALV